MYVVWICQSIFQKEEQKEEKKERKEGNETGWRAVDNILHNNEGINFVAYQQFIDFYSFADLHVP
jgi:hypothetical protein